MAMQTFNDNQVTEMIGEVETAIATLLKSEVASLRKGDAMNSAGNGGPGAGSPLERSVGDPSQAPKTSHAQPGTSTDNLGKAAPDASSAPTKEASSGAPPSDGSSGPPDASAAPSPSADPSASGAPAADPAAGAQPDAPPTKEELDSAYGQLSAPELEMHIQCATQALASKQAQMGGGMPAPGGTPGAAPGGPAAPMGSPSPSPAGAPGANPLPADQSPPLAPDAMMAMKSENQALKGQVEELTKSVTAFMEGLKGFAKPAAPQNPTVQATSMSQIQFIPAQKAVTAMDAVPQAAPVTTNLSKSEITDKLKVVVHKPELTKNERKLISRWFTGNASDQDIAPLLK